MSEWFRKFLVSLKRRPQKVPYAIIVLSCLAYTFRLSSHSAALVNINKNILAFFMFVVTLASILSIFSFVGVKKMDKSATVPLVITVTLIVLQLVLQINYVSSMGVEKVWLESTNHSSADIVKSIGLTYRHIIWLVLSLISLATLPLYAKAFRKINTDSETWHKKSKTNEDKKVVGQAGELKDNEQQAN